MAARDVLLDAGPIVAFLDRRDQWHAAAPGAWQQVTHRCLTTEAVLAEACHLMLRGRHAAASVVELVLDAGVPIVPLDREAHHHAARLMRDYADLPMDYADASLVTVAEALGITCVFTTDRRGFGTYRMAGGRRFEVVP
ncbi:MAG: type II toxin-antitoxin system VapC family toxin [Gemmatimonadales bacterium]